MDLVPMLWFLAIPAVFAQDPAPTSPDEPVDLILRVEPMKQADDRVATHLERALAPSTDRLVLCRTDALREAQEPGRFLQVKAWMRPADGGIRKLEVLHSTAVPAVDDCVLATLSETKIQPAPQYPDKLEINITWAKPQPPAEGSGDTPTN